MTMGHNLMDETFEHRKPIIMTRAARTPAEIEARLNERFRVEINEPWDESRLRFYRRLYEEIDDEGAAVAQRMGLCVGTRDTFTGYPRYTVLRTLKPWPYTEGKGTRAYQQLSQLSRLLGLVPNEYRESAIVIVTDEEECITWEAEENDLEYVLRVGPLMGRE